MDMEPKLPNAVVRTFHGFCKREFLKLHADKHPGFRFHYPALRTLLAQDFVLTGEGSADLLEEIEGAMQRREGHRLLNMWLERAERYQAYGHTDLVFRVLTAVENGESLPDYPMVIVDEYQDFSPLEREFIERLSDRSPSLIVGDDDQALYAFKFAGPEGIRDMYTAGVATTFSLPYCSRCTSVIVDSVHRLVDKAQSAGLLAARLPKPFVCYDPDKRAESEKFPKIIHARCSVQKKGVPTMARYIESEIAKITTEEAENAQREGYPSVLIIGPVPFRGQIYDYLSSNLPNVSKTSSEVPGIDRGDAIRILAIDPNANLGWRIACFTCPGLDGHVRAYLEDGRVLLRSLLPEAFVRRVLEMVLVWINYTSGASISEEAVATFEAFVGVPISEMAEERDDGEIGAEDEIEVASEDEDLSKPRILCTSFEGAKGLSADHVFIVGMNERHFPRNEPTDNDVMRLLVALTRTRKQCHLVSCRRFANSQLSDSRFISWLGNLVTCKYVDKDYFGG